MFECMINTDFFLLYAETHMDGLSLINIVKLDGFQKVQSFEVTEGPVTALQMDKEELHLVLGTR